MPKLTPVEIDNLNRPTLIKEIESIINNLIKQKAPGLNSPVNSPDEILTFKEEIVTVLYNLFQKVKTEAILPNSFWEAVITLLPKPDRDITRKL